MKSVLVTGASTGIGWGAAKVLIARSFRVFGSVRKTADADRLANEFGENFTPLIFDVTDEAAVAAASKTVAAALGNNTLAGVVNNAGISVPGPMLTLPIVDLRRQLDVNVIGQIIVTQAFAPLLGTDKARQGPKGRIVMISSVGGRLAYPFLGPYHASKFAIEGISASLRRELLLFGIDVIVVAPGSVATAIWSKAEAEDFTPYANTPYGPALRRLREAMLKLGRKGLKPEVLGAGIHRALTDARPKARYTITPDPVQDFLAAHLPARWVDRLMASQLGLRPGPA
jgi:NAD(P)-dependent dehydrogenase (short-subunit alcohol dehydrogenase family)